ncbi:MAG TPA: hypothetical protein DHV77_02275 [Erysipelotrichaceae bacterium]|nr:hypothetical protein [Erysipelotrichaceae bacterium]
MNRLSPFKWFVLQNFPFIEADFDALINYELMCKVVEYLNATIEKTNELGNQVEVLTNWFNNLDVQEEINNKLDEMAESGELEEIIAEFLNSTSYIVFDNVSDMKSSETLVNGSVCQTLGYYSIGDGGKATYKVRTITNEDVIDEGSLIALNDVSLVAELITSDVYVKQFGAVGDDETDDTDRIKNAINYALSKNKKVIVNKGTYLINETISIENETNTKNVIIEGEGLYSSDMSIIHSTASVCLYINFGIPFIKNITFKGNDAGIGVKLGSDSPTTANYSIHWGTFDNVLIRNFETGLVLGNVFDMSFKDVDIFYVKYGVQYNKNLDKSNINNLVFNRLHVESLSDAGVGLDLSNGRNVTDVLFNSLHIETRNLKAKGLILQKVAGCVINNLYLAMQNENQTISDYVTAMTIDNCRDIQITSSSISVSPKYSGSSSSYPLIKLVGTNTAIEFDKGYWSATTTTATNMENFIDRTDETTSEVVFNYIKMNDVSNECYPAKMKLSRQTNIGSSNDFAIDYRSDGITQFAKNVQSNYESINKNNGRFAISGINEPILSSIVSHRRFVLDNDTTQAITTYGRTNLSGAYIIIAHFNNRTRIGIFGCGLPDDTTIRFAVNDGSMYTPTQGTDARINVYVANGNVTIENKSGYECEIGIVPIFTSLT